MITDEVIPIFLTFDEKYVLPGGVAIYSLLKHASKAYSYKIIIAGENISPRGRKIIDYAIREYREYVNIEYINIEGDINEVWKTSIKTAYFTVEAAYKLFIAEILRQYDKIIISDVDVIFSSDISEVYQQFKIGKGYFFAGVRPVEKIYDFYNNSYALSFTPQEIIDQKNGIASGFLIADLKSIREYNKEKDFIRSFEENSNRLVQPEQDVINFTCSGHLLFLPLRFLVCNYIYDLYRDNLEDVVYTPNEIIEAMNRPVQLHFPGKPKPWESRTITKSEVWYSYLKDSGLAPLFYGMVMKKNVIEFTGRVIRKMRKIGGVVYRKLLTKA